MTGKIHSHYSLTRKVTNEAAVKKVRVSSAENVSSPANCIICSVAIMEAKKTVFFCAQGSVITGQVKMFQCV